MVYLSLSDLKSRNGIANIKRLNTQLYCISSLHLSSIHHVNETVDPSEILDNLFPVNFPTANTPLDTSRTATFLLAIEVQEPYFSTYNSLGLSEDVNNSVAKI